MHDQEVEDIVGALVRSRRDHRAPQYGQNRNYGKPSKTRPRRSYLAKQSAGIGAEFPLGFGTHQFANGGATSAILTATPQRICKPSRLTCIAARTSGAPELLTITDIKVGTQSQLISGEALPWDMFAQDAVGTELKLAQCGPGVNVYIYVSVSAAPGVAETIDVAASMVCDVLD